MKIKHIQLLLEAETELEDGRLFYESQKQGKSSRPFNASLFLQKNRPFKRHLI
jgi:hypothetical protein